MYLLHYYLQKGFTHEVLLKLSPVDKHFYNASMILAKEEEAERIKAMGMG